MLRLWVINALFSSHTLSSLDIVCTDIRRPLPRWWLSVSDLPSDRTTDGRMHAAASPFIRGTIVSAIPQRLSHSPIRSSRGQQWDESTGLCVGNEPSATHHDPVVGRLVFKSLSSSLSLFLFLSFSFSISLSLFLFLFLSLSRLCTI